MPQRLLLEGSDIDELLARVRTEHGPDARIVHAEQKLVGGVGGFFAKRRFEVAVAVDDAPSGPASIDDLLALADAQDGVAPRHEPATVPAPERQPETGGDPAAPTVPQPGRQPGRQVSTESETFDDFVRELIAQAEGGPLPVEQPSFVPATLRVETASPAGAPVQPALPAEPAQPSPSHLADRSLALLDRLREVAVRTPITLTGTQIVVGPHEPAMAVARAWVAACGEGDDAVVDCAIDAVDGRLVGPQSRPRVVVVATGGSRADARRAGRRLAALGVDAVTAVVDARWDVASTERCLDALREGGARIDQLAAHAVDDAADPLRLLELTVPVSWLDGRPATLGTWAAPCLDRL